MSMTNPQFRHRRDQAYACGVLALACAAAVNAADIYDPATGSLTIPALAIGPASYSNVIVTVGHIVSGPMGTAPAGSGDSYDPGSNQLTVPAVMVGASEYYNVVATVGGLVSIGGVTGADSYNDTHLSVPLVQFGSTVYENVMATVGSIVSIAGGMPTAAPDTYNSLTNQLAIPAVQAGNNVYTNVVVTAGKLLSVTGVYATNSESTLYSFTGRGGVSGSTDGADPEAGLIQLSDGDLYGTTAGGGVSGLAGTVFQVTASGTETVLHSFSGMVNFPSTDGVLPQDALFPASNGLLYGTTLYGGTYGFGTVFEISPAGAETVLYSFSGYSGVQGVKDGAYPGAGLILGSDGYLYGVTQEGGANNYGTLFKISLTGIESVLYSFGANITDGLQPQANLLLGNDGNFYGTTNDGGSYREGTVFKITPSGTETVLHSFSGNGGTDGSQDGASTASALIQGTDGKFYGTTAAGGAYSAGTAYTISPSGVETVLYSFFGVYGAYGSQDGGTPFSALLLGPDGNFYGTTNRGGAYGNGTAFKLTPTGVETALHSFSGNGGLPDSTDGQYPGTGQLILGIDGSIYGTTNSGGAHDVGAVYKLTIVTAP
jgi:uncharacterized repeat protein (TIGR03803 family)